MKKDAIKKMNQGLKLLCIRFHIALMYVYGQCVPWVDPFIAEEVFS